MLHGAVAWLALLAATTDSPQWEAPSALARGDLEVRLIDDCTNGVLDSHSLLQAALIAAGETNQSKMDAVAASFQWLADRAVATASSSPQSSTPQALSQQMHQIFLTGKYRAACSDLRQTVMRGDYNCVGATIVYQVLCEASDIKCHAVAVPAHVFSRLEDDGGLDVQTTCSKWLGRGKGRTSVKETEQRRELSNVQLIGKVYYNRGVLALHDDDFAEAVRVLRISLVLDPGDAIAKNNLLAAINNWSLAEAGRGRFGSASELLAIGRSLDPHYSPLQANDLHIHQRWVQRLCRDGRFEFALGILQDGLRRQPESELYDDGRYVVLRLWANELWQTGSLEDGFDVFERRWNRSQLNDALVMAVTTTVSQLTAKARHATALELARRAQRRVKDDRLERLVSRLSE